MTIITNRSPIQEQIKNLGTLSPEKKNIFTQEMLELFQKASQENSPNRDDIRDSSFAYGRCIYGGDMLESAKYLHISMIETLFKNKIVPEEKVTSLYKAPLKEVMPEESVLLDFAEKTPEEALFLAQNLRWLGHAYQNISIYQSKMPQNIERFNLIYDTSEKLLNTIVKVSGLSHEIGKDANWEVAELLYNTSRFRYELSGGTNPLEKIATLKYLKTPLSNEGSTTRSLKLKAQIENISMIEITALEKKETDLNRKKELLELRWKHVCNAVEIVESSSEFPDLFLAAMFYNNKAGLALESELAKLDEIERWTQKAVEFASKSDNNHYYFSFFYYTAGAVAKKLGKSDEAKKYLETAMMICKKFPDQTKDQLEKTQNLLNELVNQQ